MLIRVQKVARADFEEGAGRAQFIRDRGPPCRTFVSLASLANMYIVGVYISFFYICVAICKSNYLVSTICVFKSLLKKSFIKNYI